MLQVIIIKKCRICLTTQTFRMYNPSSVRKIAEYAFVKKSEHPPRTTGTGNEASISAGNRAAGLP